MLLVKPHGSKNAVITSAKTHAAAHRHAKKLGITSYSVLEAHVVATVYPHKGGRRRKEVK